jgi:hypothetical protein
LNYGISQTDIEARAAEVTKPQSPKKSFHGRKRRRRRSSPTLMSVRRGTGRLCAPSILQRSQRPRQMQS